MRRRMRSGGKILGMKQLGLLLFLMVCRVNFAFAQPIKPLLRPTPTPTPATINVPQYRGQLDKQIGELRQMEKTPVRPLVPWMQNRAKDEIIKRDDGITQKATSGEWDRRVMRGKGNATKDEVRAVRESLEQRRAALDEWTRRDAEGRYFSGADAQTRIAQLEKSGVIRTGPTAIQQWMSNARKWFSQTIDKLFRWIFGALPSAPSGSVPSIDPIWIKGLFYLVLLALVGAIGYLLIRPIMLHWDRWRFFWRRNDARRKVEFTGEDAELLQLPPDELLERARAFAAQGNFREALRHIYIRLLLQLDARGVWRYDTRRTNWEHIAALRQSHTTLAQPMSDLTRRFDRVRYGNAPCSDTDWQKFQNDALAVENSLSPKS